MRHVLIDTNYWKSFVHARLAVSMGDPGCLSLFGRDDKAHRLLADHLIAAWCTRRAHANFIDGATLSLEAVELAANEVWWWVSGQNVANPLTGDAVDEVLVSNGSTDTATFRLAVLYDSTP